jgi:hypothetical protein
MNDTERCPILFGHPLCPEDDRVILRREFYRKKNLLIVVHNDLE